MAEQLAEIEAIAEAAETPSFANTIEAMERSGRLLGRVSRVFHNLDASNTSDEIEGGGARDYAPKLAQHHMRIQLNAALFRRVADLHEASRRAGPCRGPDAAARALSSRFSCAAAHCWATLSGRG